MKEYKFNINGNNYNVVINEEEDNVSTVEVNGTPFKVTRTDEPVKKKIFTKVQAPRPTAPATPVAPPVVVSGDHHAVVTPLPGVVLSINCKEGDMVKTGQKLLVLEAMKMENSIEADKDGKVISIKVNKGDSVLEGAPLVILG